METCPNCKKEILEGLPFCPYCGTKRATSSTNDNTFINEDPYQIFQISRNAEPEIIEAVYKSLARKYHPDNGINENDERIKKINWAYAILRDKEKRSIWDLEHPKSEPNKSSFSKPQSDPIPNISEAKDHQNKSTIPLILSISLIIIIILSISLSNYNREYKKMSSFYATSNAQVNLKNQSLNQSSAKISQLTSTIAMQSSTLTAQKSTITAHQTFLVSAGKPFQQGSGNLKHSPNDKYIVEYCIDEYKDFIVEVVYINPYKATYNAGWDFGILFSDQGLDEQYRLVLSSDSRWALHEGISEPLKSGWINNFVTTENGQNKLRVVVLDDLVSFYVNGTFIDAISLPKKVIKGDLCLATGLYEGDEVKGESTEYIDLIVYPLIPIE